MKKEVEIKKRLSAEMVASLLTDLAESFRAGIVCVENDADFVTLKPGTDVEVEIEAANKKDKQKFSLKLSWKEAEPVSAASECGLKISSREPEISAPLAEEDGCEGDATHPADEGCAKTV